MKYTIEKQHAMHMPMNHRTWYNMIPPCCGRGFVLIRMDTVAVPTCLGVTGVEDSNVALLIPTILNFVLLVVVVGSYRNLLWYRYVLFASTFVRENETTSHTCERMTTKQFDTTNLSFPTLIPCHVNM